MELSNEEKKKIGDAASAMMQAFCELRLAGDRLQVANTLAGNLVQIKLPEEAMKGLLSPYMAAFAEKQKFFFETLGIGEDNKEFWDWYKEQAPSMEELKRKRATL